MSTQDPPVSKLGRLKALRAVKAAQACSGALSAGKSHLLNDAYMGRFDTAFASPANEAPGKVSGFARRRVKGPQPGSTVAVSQLGSKTASSQATESPVSNGSRPAAVSHLPAAGAAGQPSWVTRGPQAPGATPALPWTLEEARATSVKLSDRNILCASLDWTAGEAVFGCADHALYAVDICRSLKARALYSKRFGHSEWVTAVRHLPATGGIVSGGMDSKLCLWDKARTTCEDLQGHSGSISHIELADSVGSRFVSASYDKTLVLWEAHSGCKLLRLAGHQAPVLQLCTASSAGGGPAAAASGDRSGGLIVWDLGTGKARCRVASAHQGHITALARESAEPSESSNPFPGHSSTVLLSGGQDGYLRVWDLRAVGPSAEAAAHVGQAGLGAVSALLAPTHGDSLVVTAGADGHVTGLDRRQGLQQAWAVQLPDFPYSLAAQGSLVLAGCGDGSLVVIDRCSGTVLCTTQASSAAVRTVDSAGGKLITGGDDGVAVVYQT